MAQTMHLDTSFGPFFDGAIFFAGIIVFAGGGRGRDGPGAWDASYMSQAHLVVVVVVGVAIHGDGFTHTRSW